MNNELTAQLSVLEEGKVYTAKISERIEYDIVRVPDGWVYHPYQLMQETTCAGDDSLRTHSWTNRKALNPFYVPFN